MFEVLKLPKKNFEINLENFPNHLLRMRGHARRKMPSVPVPYMSLTEHLDGKTTDLPEIPIYIKKHEGQTLMIAVLPSEEEV